MYSMNKYLAGGLQQKHKLMTGTSKPLTASQDSSKIRPYITVNVSVYGKECIKVLNVQVKGR